MLGDLLGVFCVQGATLEQILELVTSVWPQVVSNIADIKADRHTNKDLAN